MFLVYSIGADIQDVFLWGIFLKSIIMMPAIVAFHNTYGRQQKNTKTTVCFNSLQRRKQVNRLRSASEMLVAFIHLCTGAFMG